MSDGVRENALRMLKDRGFDARLVVHVVPDAVLYVDSIGRAKTAWMRYAGGELVIAIESGYPAEPSASSLRVLDRASAAAAGAQTKP